MTYHMITPRCGICMVLVATLSTFAMSSQAMAALGEVGFQVNISSKEMVLANPGDMSVKMFSAWDTPYQRIADRNMPFIEVKNLSESTGNLTQFNITIGDTDYEYSDSYFGEYAMLGETTPDVPISSMSVDGDLLTVNIGDGGLAPGELVRFRIDIDPDPSTEGVFPHPDFRLVLFDMNDFDGNGETDNAVVSAVFTDPNDISMTAEASTQLPDYPVSAPESNYFNQIVRPYSVMEGVDVFPAIVITDPIPEPSTLVLLGLTMSAAGVWYRRRNS